MNNTLPWEEYPHIWKTQAAFMSFVRGGIRRGLWEKNPIKLQFIKNNRKRVPLGRKTEANPEGLVWGCQCSICNGDFKQSECQVDHKDGNNSLKSMEDVRNFIESMILIIDSDLSFVCKPCHKIKTHAERKGISFNQARVEKEAIRFQKLDKKVQLQFLKKHDFKDSETSNSKKRRECFMLLNTNIDGEYSTSITFPEE